MRCGQRSLRRLLCGLAMALVAAVAPWAEAQAGGVACTLIPIRETFLVGEPLVFAVRVENTGDAPVTIVPPFSVGDGQCAVFLQRPGQSEWSRIGPSVHREGPALHLELEPGERLPAWRALLPVDGFAEDRPALPLLLVPGEHRVRVELGLPRSEDAKEEREGGVVVSNVLRFTVREAEGRDADALALWLTSMQRSHWLLSGVGVEDDDLRRLRQAYPDTVYGQYAAHMRTSDGCVLEETELQGRSAEAYRRELLEDLYANAPDFALRDAVMLRLGDLYQRAGRCEDATEVHARLRAEIPDAPAADRLAYRESRDMAEAPSDR